MNQDVCIKVYASLCLVYIYSFLLQSVLFFQMQYFLLFINKRWHIPCLKIVVFIFFLILGIVFNVSIEYDSEEDHCWCKFTVYVFVAKSCQFITIKNDYCILCDSCTSSRPKYLPYILKGVMN